MKLKKVSSGFLFLCFFILVFFGFSFADESLTITTYYPSPYGAYNQLNTNTLQFGKQTAIPTCSPGTEGLTLYSNINGVNNLYVCTYDSTASPSTYTWWPVVTFPSVAYNFGGYQRGSYTYDTGSGSYIVLRNGWSMIGTAVARSNYDFKINLRNQPAGEYEFTWSVDVDVDQYASTTQKGYVRFHVDALGTDGTWYCQDSSVDLKDDDYTGVAGTYTNHPAAETERTFSKYYSRQSTTSDVWRAFRIVAYKNLGADKLHVTINNARLTIVRPAN